MAQLEGLAPTPRGAATRVMREARASFAFIERNFYLTKRYWGWEIAFLVYTAASSLSIMFIGESQPGDTTRLILFLAIGTLVWGYLNSVFANVAETVAWERWEGTIEYTFMAPLSRPVHLLGMGTFAILYGLLRATLLFGVCAFFFDLSLPVANFGAALLVLAVASVSFVGIGMMTAVLPLVSPEKGTQLGFVAQGVLLVVSGVYYPVDVLPGWMQAVATVSPATYALDGIRDAILSGDGMAAMIDELWPLALIGALFIPLGLAVFRAGERYAKQHGKLKRSG